MRSALVLLALPCWGKGLPWDLSDTTASDIKARLDEVRSAKWPNTDEDLKVMVDCGSLEDSDGRGGCTGKSGMKNKLEGLGTEIKEAADKVLKGEGSAFDTETGVQARYDEVQRNIKKNETAVRERIADVMNRPAEGEVGPGIKVRHNLVQSVLSDISAGQARLAQAQRIKLLQKLKETLKDGNSILTQFSDAVATEAKNTKNRISGGAGVEGLTMWITGQVKDLTKRWKDAKFDSYTGIDQRYDKLADAEVALGSDVKASAREFTKAAAELAGKIAQEEADRDEQAHTVVSGAEKRAREQRGLVVGRLRAVVAEAKAVFKKEQKAAQKELRLEARAAARDVKAQRKGWHSLTKKLDKELAKKAAAGARLSADGQRVEESVEELSRADAAALSDATKAVHELKASFSEKGTRARQLAKEADGQRGDFGAVADTVDEGTKKKLEGVGKEATAEYRVDVESDLSKAEVQLEKSIDQVHQTFSEFKALSVAERSQLVPLDEPTQELDRLSSEANANQGKVEAGITSLGAIAANLVGATEAEVTHEVGKTEVWLSGMKRNVTAGGRHLEDEITRAVNKSETMLHHIVDDTEGAEKAATELVQGRQHFVAEQARPALRRADEELRGLGQEVTELQATVAGAKSRSAAAADAAKNKLNTVMEALAEEVAANISTVEAESKQGLNEQVGAVRREVLADEAGADALERSGNEQIHAWRQQAEPQVDALAEKATQFATREAAVETAAAAAKATVEAKVKVLEKSFDGSLASLAASSSEMKRALAGAPRQAEAHAKVALGDAVGVVDAWSAKAREEAERAIKRVERAAVANATNAVGSMETAAKEARARAFRAGDELKSLGQELTVAKAAHSDTEKNISGAVTASVEQLGEIRAAYSATQQREQKALAAWETTAAADVTRQVGALNERMGEAKHGLVTSSQERLRALEAQASEQQRNLTDQAHASARAAESSMAALGRAAEDERAKSAELQRAQEQAADELAEKAAAARSAAQNSEVSEERARLSARSSGVAVLSDEATSAEQLVWALERIRKAGRELVASHAANWQQRLKLADEGSGGAAHKAMRAAATEADTVAKALGAAANALVSEMQSRRNKVESMTQDIRENNGLVNTSFYAKLAQERSAVESAKSHISDAGMREVRTLLQKMTDTIGTTEQVAAQMGTYAGKAKQREAAREAGIARVAGLVGASSGGLADAIVTKADGVAANHSASEAKWHAFTEEDVAFKRMVYKQLKSLGVEATEALEAFEDVPPPSKLEGDLQKETSGELHSAREQLQDELKQVYAASDAAVEAVLNDESLSAEQQQQQVQALQAQARQEAAKLAQKQQRIKAREGALELALAKYAAAVTAMEERTQAAVNSGLLAPQAREVVQKLAAANEKMARLRHHPLMHAFSALQVGGLRELQASNAQLRREDDDVERRIRELEAKVGQHA